MGQQQRGDVSAETQLRPGGYLGAVGITEALFTASGKAYPETTLVHEPMVMPAQQYEIIQAGATAVLGRPTDCEAIRGVLLMAKTALLASS